jgi:PAS domain S-box-containing protein
MVLSKELATREPLKQVFCGMARSHCLRHMMLSDFVNPPKARAGEKFHQSWSLHIILWTVLIFVTAMMVFDILTLPQNMIRWIGVLVFIVPVCLVLIRLNHRGQTRIASIAAVAALWLMVTVLIATENTLRAPGAPAYLLIIFTAGLLLGTRAGITTGVVCALTATGFVVLESCGYLQKSAVRHTPVVYWFTQLLFMFMILSLQWLANRSVLMSLRRAERELEERKRAEETLRESEERYRIVVEQTGQMVYDYDIPSGKIKWQGALTQVTGYPAQQFESVGIQQWEEMIHAEDRPKAVQLLEKAMKTLGFYKAEYRFRCRDNSFCYVEDHGVCLPGPCGNAVRILGTMTDITARKGAEDKNAELTRSLEQRVRERTAELETANQELEAFSYSVSHDLRGPLRAVDGFCEILLRQQQGQLAAGSANLLLSIQTSAKRMNQLINDLLQLANVGRQPLKTAEVDVQGLVARIIRDMSGAEEGREIKVTVGTLPPCLGDASLIEQVFVNLLSNAFKFTRRRPLAEIGLDAERHGAQVQYSVRDNGAGFNMQNGKKLFSPFERMHSTADFEGTGIGLSIVQRIVQRHGGRIWAQSAVDQGTTFTFTLSAAESKPAPGLLPQA